MQRKMQKLVVCAIAAILLGGLSIAQYKSPDLTGTWQIHYADDNGVSTSHPKLVLKQSGGKLTGTFGDRDWPIIGTVDRSHIVFTFTAYGHEGQKAISDTVFYWGTINNERQLSGRMKNPKEAGDWEAIRN